MREGLYWIILLTGLFLVLFYWRAMVSVIDATTAAVGNAITKLQGGGL